MEKRVAKVEGLYLQGEPNECFSGTITFELRPDCICYGWSINTKEGIWLKGMSVSLRVIPEDKEYFEFALQHSLEVYVVIARTGRKYLTLRVVLGLMMPKVKS